MEIAWTVRESEVPRSQPQGLRSAWNEQLTEVRVFNHPPNEILDRRHERLRGLGAGHVTAKARRELVVFPYREALSIRGHHRQGDIPNGISCSRLEGGAARAWPSWATDSLFGGAARQPRAARRGAQQNRVRMPADPSLDH